MSDHTDTKRHRLTLAEVRGLVEQPQPTPELVPCRIPHQPWMDQYLKTRNEVERYFFLTSNRPLVVRARIELKEYNRKIYRTSWEEDDMLRFIPLLLKDIESAKQTLESEDYYTKKLFKFGAIDSVQGLDKKANFLLGKLKEIDPKTFGCLKAPQDVVRFLAQKEVERIWGPLMIEVGPDVKIYEKQLETHLRGIGKTRSGKSKLIELICRQLLLKEVGFCLIDPHGTLFKDVLAWIALTRPKKLVHLFEPSCKEKIVGFDPFWLDSKDEAEIMTHAEKMVEATMSAWDMDDITRAPRLAKWLKRLYYTLIEQQLSIVDVECFLNNSQIEKRNRIITNIKNDSVRESLKELYSRSEKGFAAYMESTENRLEIFTHPQIRRIMGLKENSLDLKGLLDRQETLLVNLQPSATLSRENNRVLGSLLVNQIWQIARERIDPKPYYLIIDECQEFLTPDVAAMLDQATKRGIRMALFHQREEQLSKNLASALQNAQTKFIFSTDKEPKQQRRFDLELPHHRRRTSSVSSSGRFQVPQIDPPPVSDTRIEQDKRERLRSFLTPEEVDQRLNKPNNKKKVHKESSKELTDEEFLR